MKFRYRAFGLFPDSVKLGNEALGPRNNTTFRYPSTVLRPMVDPRHDRPAAAGARSALSQAVSVFTQESPVHRSTLRPFRSRLHSALLSAAVAVAGSLAVAPTAEAQFGGRSGMATMFIPDFYPRDLPVFVDALQLEEWQRPIMEALLEDYVTEFNTAADGVRLNMGNLKDVAPGTSGDAVVEMITKPLVAWTAEKRKLHDDFLTGVRSQLSELQLELWPRLERSMRREHLRLGAGRHRHEPHDRRCGGQHHAQVAAGVLREPGAESREIGLGERGRLEHAWPAVPLHEQRAELSRPTLGDGQERVVMTWGRGILHCSRYSRMRAGSVERSMTAVISTSSPVVEDLPRLVTVKT
jgi:hypothetical protein